MKIDEIIESEITMIVDELNCLDLENTVSAEILAISHNAFDIGECITNVYTLGGYPPANLDGFIQVYELEVPADMIESDEIDDVTIKGEYAYIYIGSGIGFDVDKEALKELSE